MNDTRLLQEYVRLSQTAGARADYVQGGGGNTSVKLSEGRMAVKASGFRLNQVQMDAAYCVVDAKGIRDWYASVDMAEDRDFEKESVAIAKGAVVPGFGPQGLRPSVEAGFHAVLGTFVVHTHAVQANLLCCSAEGEALVRKLFTDAGFPALWIPYINPGFCLTLRIRDARERMIRETGADPHILFMENHGLIVWGEDADAALALHDEVNNRILDYFGIQGTFPVPEVKTDGEGRFISGTPEVQTFLKVHAADAAFFEAHPLYPDQLVYLNAGMLGAAETRKMELEPTSGEVVYQAGESEALAMEETLLGFVWVMNQISALGLTLKTMSATDVDFIRNWESEAYRRSLVQKMKQ
jgi:ribulose-5-phosphate 4-epimerase/fuculose-1-phosphate aldolase